MRITPKDIDALAVGAALLGSGGGGDSRIGATILAGVLPQRLDVRLMAADLLRPDDLVVAVAIFGAGPLMGERLPSGREFSQAVGGLEAHLGRKVAAVQATEVGGINAMAAVAFAAALDLPLVDADGMGRAFPRLDQTVFSAAKIPAAPVCLVGPAGQTILIVTSSNSAVEEIVRATLPSLGGWAAGAYSAMPASVAAECGLRGTLSGALRLGTEWRRAQSRGDDALRSTILSDRGGRIVFTGIVREIRARSSKGLGVLTLEHRLEPERTLRVELSEEYLLAMDDGDVVAAVPEIISLVDAESWHPVSTDKPQLGQHVDVIRLPAPAPWVTGPAAELVSLEAFGLAPLRCERSNL